MTSKFLKRTRFATVALGVLLAVSGCRTVGTGIGIETADSARHVSADLAEPAPMPATNAEAFMSGLSADNVRSVRLVSADAVASAADEHTGPSAQPDEAVPAGQSLDLATLLWIVDGQNPQVALARERIAEAYAQRARAGYLWLPSLRAGLNYNKHEGAIQDVVGRVFDTSRGAIYGGLGAAAVGAGSPAVPGVWANFHLADACFQPQIAGHEASARSHAAEATRNAFLRDAAVAYWELVRAEQQQAVAREALQHTQQLAQLTETYARTGQGLKADQQRVEAELAVRRSELLQTDEAIRVASAQLVRLLGGDPLSRIVTAEQAVMPLELTAADTPAVELVELGLSRRPELAESRHLVYQACQRLRRERFAPLIPSVVLGLSYGGFGGGLGSEITNTSDRLDADVAAYWELRQLGLGERAVRAEASSRVRQAELRQAADLDRVAAEVVTAHTQVQTRAGRIEVARSGILAAEDSFRLNSERIQHAQGLPIEVLQSIQSLAVLRREYLNAVVDYNIAQFQLWWAAGWFSEPVTALPAED